MKIALFGGSFNPPHYGHIQAVNNLLTINEFSEVWIIPCGSHAFGKELASFKHRFEMAKIAFSGFSKTKIIDIEEKLSKPNRTIDTIDFLKEKYPYYDFTLVVGSDILDEMPKWKDFEKIEDEVDILLLPRKGYKKNSKYKILNKELPKVSSSEIRRLLKKDAALDDLLPLSIIEYISKNKLYC